MHRFAADGQLIASWGRPGGDGPGAFYSPHCLWVAADGLVYVCDGNNNRIQIFDAEVKSSSLQWNNVQLPTDLHIGRYGLCYLAEREIGDAAKNLLTVARRFRQRAGKLV